MAGYNAHVCSYTTTLHPCTYVGGVLVLAKRNLTLFSMIQ